MEVSAMLKLFKTILRKKSLMIGLIGSVVLSPNIMASKQHKHAQMKHSDSKPKEQKRKKLDQTTKESLVEVLEANEKLHHSFFQYDANAVEKYAKALKKAISNIKDGEIRKLLSFSQKKLSKIKASNERKTNNQNYHLVSMALIHIVNTYDVGEKYNAYSCPMVKKKWVQNSQKMTKVHNPYAPNMPHCGSKDSDY